MLFIQHKYSPKEIRHKSVLVVTDESEAEEMTAFSSTGLSGVASSSFVRFGSGRGEYVVLEIGLLPLGTNWCPGPERERESGSTPPLSALSFCSLRRL